MRAATIYLGDHGQVRGLDGLTFDELTSLAAGAVNKAIELQRVTEAEGAPVHGGEWVRVQSYGEFTGRTIS